VRAIGSRATERSGWPLRQWWPDLAWAAFAAANLVAMGLVPGWETIPFHFIWVSLTLMYGYRVWEVYPTTVVLFVVAISTGTLISYDVARAGQSPDELTEVPLMAAMFAAMVWHAQRRRSAMDQLRRVSDTNLRLLQRGRQFVQDASHELRTPITVALGHAELIVRQSRDPELTEDARIVVDELLRLRRLADRLLLLATAEDPDFLSTSSVEVGKLLVDVLQRWAPTDRDWQLEARTAAAATVTADPDRLGLALDSLIENAVKHSGPGDQIRLGARRRDGRVVITVADSGSGIPGDMLEGIFERFTRLDDGRSRDRGGVGLGLAVVKAIAVAHGGSARCVRSVVGKGSVFQIELPLRPQPELASADPAGERVATAVHSPWAESAR
jgi:signal transduction histidine kinase